MEEGTEIISIIFETFVLELFETFTDKLPPLVACRRPRSCCPAGPLLSVFTSQTEWEWETVEQLWCDERGEEESSSSTQMKWTSLWGTLNFWSVFCCYGPHYVCRKSNGCQAFTVYRLF